MLNILFTRFMMSLFVTSPLIGIILLIKKTLKNHISSMWQYNMGFLFLVILVLPFIPIRFFNTGVLLSHYIGNAPFNENMTVVSPSNGISNGIDWLQDFTLSVNRSTPGYVSLLLIGIWLAGILVYSVITLICYQKIGQIKKSVKPINMDEVKEILEQCKRELNITKNFILCQSALVQTPIAIGIIKTYIILPSQLMEQISVNHIKYIILHELQHDKNKDLIVNDLMCFLQILYWFNPFVYLAFREMRTDREIACDASVLKLLEKSNYIDYGMIIINFVEKLSQPVPLTLATGMVGPKKQITKRIEKIASFKEDSMQLKIKSIGIFIIAVLLILTQLPVISVMAFDSDGYHFSESQNVTYESLSAYFGGFEGSFVLYDLQEETYSIYNKDKSVTRVSPDSTYKIYSALIGLELDVIQDGNSVISWDGTEHPFEPWNKDHDLHSAMKDSVNWYFQSIDTVSGVNNLQKYLKDIGYGNYDLSGGLLNYWAESSLLISPVEQVQLLKDFYLNAFTFKQESIHAVKNALKLSEKNGANLSGKTGTGSVNGKGVNGWFVGYVEKDGNTYIFATNIAGEDRASGRVAAEITLSILSDKSIY